MQRQRLIRSSASVLVTMIVTAAIATGILSDSYDARIDDLEARVSRLEAEVGIATATPLDHAGATEVTGEPTAFPVTPITDGAFNSSWTSSGNADYTLDISIPGTYQVTAQSNSPLALRVVSAEGEAVLTVDAGADGTISTMTNLDPGSYTLSVEGSAQWAVIVTSVSGSADPGQ